MAKLGMISWCCLLILGIAPVTKAETAVNYASEATNPPVWEFSLQQSKVNGWFDYLLYYPEQTQLLSQVSFPQKQLMPLLKLKYTPLASDFFIQFQYGWSGKGFKGSGSDSDWTIPGSDQLTFYGEFDTYGRQSLVAADWGVLLRRDAGQRISLLLGFLQQTNTNELKNGVYYRYEGIDVGAWSQEDLGSTLDSKFQGVRLAIEAERRWAHWTWHGRVGLAFLQTKAYGHWANHDPAWNWVNSGHTIGWTADLGLEYAITRKTAVELGYNNYNARNYFDRLACDESISGEGFEPGGELYPDRVILRQQLQGFYLGIKVRF